MFKGSIVAIVTPFKDDKVDIDALKRLVAFHLDAGTHGIVAAGTTGESGTLSHEEKLLVIKTIIDEAAGNIPVIAGTACNATKECIALTKETMELGADAALIMTPAYIRPTQEGLLAHYEAIAQAVAIPIILYNVPTRTGCDMLPATVAQLSSLSNIVGIKEAVGDINRLHALQQLCEKRIDIFSGEDNVACEWILSGAKGVISVTANVAPKLMAKLADAALDGDKDLSLKFNEDLTPLNKALFVETNPIPTKWALYKMGLISDEIRLPLTRLSTKYHDQVMNAIPEER